MTANRPGVGDRPPRMTVIGTGGGATYLAGAQASANPFSISGTYNNGPLAVMAGYERNAVETKVMSVGAAFNVTPELKLMALASRQDQENTFRINPETKAWVLGANYTMGPGKILAGYGQKDPDGITAKTKQMSLGYEYSLSKRTYVYIDASRKKSALAAPNNASRGTVNYYDLGVNHSF